MPCRKVLQNLNELEKSISSKTILFIKKDIGSNEISNKQLVEEYNIKAVPLLLFIKNNEILYRIEGLKDGNFLKSIIDRFHPNQ
ncbi:thioredoxin [Candidatus Pinguicoccus supinus]|uniref:Thioredoxin n=1 Tax=Candidatus Pinguicoccus supinus TaxID=2529394 RepID=A0A7T0BRS7_9BACT|nr:thioredoxin [Candidatus Pinguicoccus supinus]